MVIRHILALVTASLFAPSLIGAEVKLGPETTVAEITSRPASTGSPTVASNGHDFLAAWWDSTGIFVARIGRDGARGAVRRIDSGSDPFLASDGNAYLLVWHGALGMQAQRLDE